MGQTLEERMAKLEKTVAELIARKTGPRKDWWRTFGLSRDDEGFDEMVRLGQEYRRNLKHPESGDRS